MNWSLRCNICNTKSVLNSLIYICLESIVLIVPSLGIKLLIDDDDEQSYTELHNHVHSYNSRRMTERHK